MPAKAWGFGVKTIKNSKLMKSELERYKEIIKIGDKVIYTDTVNGMLYEVVSVCELGIKVMALTEKCNAPKGECEFLLFSELQIGWYLSKNVKIENKIEFD